MLTGGKGVVHPLQGLGEDAAPGPLTHDSSGWTIGCCLVPLPLSTGDFDAMQKIREVMPGAEASDPGEVRLHRPLNWDEAQLGCTRVVEVDGRLEWLDIPAGALDGQELTFPGRGDFLVDD